MSLLRSTLPLTQTHFQSPQSTSPRGQRACPGTWPESRVAPGAGCARVRHGGRSGAKERAGPARAATHISPLRDENVSCPISRTRCSVNFFLGCLKKEPDGKGDGNWSHSVFCRFLTACWAGVSASTGAQVFTTLAGFPQSLETNEPG